MRGNGRVASLAVVSFVSACGSGDGEGARAPGASPDATGGAHTGGEPPGGAKHSEISGGSANAGAGGTGGVSALASGGVAPSTGGSDAAGDAGETGGRGPGPGPGPGPDSGAPDPYSPLALAQIGAPVRISDAFALAEGPLWDPCGNRLLFTDVSANVVHALDANDQVSVFLTGTHNANGLAFDIDGSLLMAEMGQGGRIVKRTAAGELIPMTPPGARFHTPDDLTVRSDGTVFFTDGEFLPVGGINLGQLPIFTIAPGTQTHVQRSTAAGPNGIELSADEKTLYVAAYHSGAVVAFDVTAEGALEKRRTFASGLVNPDSLCLDAAGNVYIGVSTGIVVARPNGARVGLVRVAESQGVTNCTFGGPDGKTLYVTAWSSLWKIPKMPIPGLEWKVNTERMHCPANP